ncbi:MAG: hypothetical protein ACI4N0_07945 [Christensenellales bacterium]
MSFKIKPAPSSDTVTKTFRMPADMMDYLDKLACKHNLSLNALVIQCLQYAIDNLDTDDEG